MISGSRYETVLHVNQISISLLGNKFDQPPETDLSFDPPSTRFLIPTQQHVMESESQYDNGFEMSLISGAKLRGEIEMFTPRI